MKKAEFEKALENIQVGDYLKIYVRGNYGNYAAEGKFLKVDDGYLHFNLGKVHSYKRILSILVGGRRFS